MIPFFLVTRKPALTVGLLPRLSDNIRLSLSLLLLTASCLLAFVFVEAKQIFEQIVIAIYEIDVVGPRNRSVPQNTGRRPVVSAHRRQISIDQRLHNPLSLPAIIDRCGLIR